MLVQEWFYNDSYQDAARDIMRKTGLSRIASNILAKRGLTNADEIYKFLEPGINDLYDPFLLNDMDKAVKRIHSAVKHKEKIIIYGDYDADGVTSSALLSEFFKLLGINIDVFIPHRLEEGYGISFDTLEKIIPQSPDLLITVDCGITAFDEIDYLNSKNIDVIVTDHHECHERLPSAIAVINPHRHDSYYPFINLAGVGVAFKLVQALCREFGLGEKFMDFIDIAAIGTVADIVDLIDENRVIVKLGIERIKNNPNTGIKALMNAAGILPDKLNSTGIAFGLVPRINAAGRISDAKIAVKLFQEKDENKAQEIAKQLNDFNLKRQQIEEEIFNEAIKEINSSDRFSNKNVYVVCGENWHHGVIGIVASRIVEEFRKPCIILSEESGIAKGSARSIEGFNIFEAIASCKDILIKFGGHEMAAGLSVPCDKVPEFDERLNQYAIEQGIREKMIKPFEVDGIISEEDINIKTAEELGRFEPFGTGNPKPVFALKNVILHDTMAIGKNFEHLRINFKIGHTFAESVWFNADIYTKILSPGKMYDAIVSMELNRWNSMEKVQFQVKHIIAKDKDGFEKQKLIYVNKNIVFNKHKNYNINNICSLGLEKNIIVPQRCHYETSYRVLNCCKQNNELYIKDLFEFALKIKNNSGIDMNIIKLRFCLQVFDELGLMKVEFEGCNSAKVFFPQNSPQKVSLEASSVYNMLSAI